MFEQRGLVALVGGGATAELLDLGAPPFLGTALRTLCSPDLCRDARSYGVFIAISEPIFARAAPRREHHRLGRACRHLR